MRDFDDGSLGVAVQQQITFSIYHDGAAHFVAPIIVMRYAAQAAFYASQHNRHVLKGLATALAIDDGSTVRTLAAYITRRVGVITADFAICGVAVDHGVHVAAGHTPK